MTRKITILLSILLLCALCFTACQPDRHNRAKRSGGQDADVRALILQEIGSNPEHALLMVDSLEQLAVISSGYANCLRSQIHAEQYQPRLSEIYALRALKNDQLINEDSSRYYFTYNLLINSALNVNNLEKALSYASKARTYAVSHDDAMSRSYAPDFLTCIGDCQLLLNRVKEGNETLSKAYDEYEALLKHNRQFAWHYPALMLTTDAVNHNINQGNIETGISWIPRMDSAYQRTIATKDIPDKAKDDILAECEIAKAKAYARAGRKAEAKEHYALFKTTQYGQSDMGVKESVSYLEAMGEWREVLASTEVADSFFRANETVASTDYVHNTLGTKFQSQLHLGQKDAALQTANRIVTLLDTLAEIADRQNAAELSVIYETQEKEAMIAEQRASISRQRTATTFIILLLLLAFLTAFIIHRHRAARKLAAKNRELEEKNHELTIANARAEESSRMKTGFIRQISHEIRTPLNILSGFTQIVTTPNMKLSDEQMADINQRIKENTDRITGLVNKMLELSEAGSQSVIERSDDVPAVQIAAQAADESGIGQAAHVDFDMQTAEGADSVMLRTNLRSATRALVLLLDNARKFTRPAEAHHRDDAVEHKERVLLRLQVADGRVLFTVEDTGIGVPAAEAEHIFEEFVQLDEYYDGTGIGLTVARSIARRLGGDITLDTGYTTGGARFVMTLPTD